MRRLSARPHALGSPYGKENAEFLASLFRSWGYDTTIEEFRVLFPTPRTRVLEMVEPTRFQAALAEPALKEDATSGQAAEQLPAYNAYSIDGDVTAPLVYVNYGVPRDYEELERRGIDVKGKIVIARYGGSWRGIKPKVAAEHGAIGCLIYSDPRDDGYFEGDVYPEGRVAQRAGRAARVGGRHAALPGRSADAGRRRDRRTPSASPLSEAPTLTKIPVLPISYADAQPLLRALGGPVAPEAWRGALPITYHLGPGPAKVHLKLAFDWKLVPAYNVIARLPGSERPDEWIVRGNHHDAWVNGAERPDQRPGGADGGGPGRRRAAQGGLAPKRTHRLRGLGRRGAGTARLDGVGGDARGRAAAEGRRLRQHRRQRPRLPQHGRLALAGAVRQRGGARRRGSADQGQRGRAARGRGPCWTRSAEDRKEARERRDLRIARPRLRLRLHAVPAAPRHRLAQPRLRRRGRRRVYHSIYDSFDHYTRFGDPTFDYGVALAQTAGRAMLRLANADVLPFEFTAFADTVGRYVKEVAKLADDMRDETEETNRRLRDRTYQLAADPKQVQVLPSPRPAVPYINFAPLQNAKARVEESARAFDEARGRRGRPRARCLSRRRRRSTPCSWRRSAA